MPCWCLENCELGLPVVTASVYCLSVLMRVADFSLQTVSLYIIRLEVIAEQYMTAT